MQLDLRPRLSREVAFPSTKHLVQFSSLDMRSAELEFSCCDVGVISK